MAVPPPPPPPPMNPFMVLAQAGYDILEPILESHPELTRDQARFIFNYSKSNEETEAMVEMAREGLL